MVAQFRLILAVVLNCSLALGQATDSNKQPPAGEVTNSAAQTAASANQTAAAPDQAIKPVQTTITVNAELTEESPQFITILNQENIQSIAGTELDDRLRQVPGFSLFRRSSSVVANPTTQGVSLRGVGSTGASRTLMLWDGVPVNDPFGGWVYWDRLDPFYVDRVEVLRGAATSVFGDRAMTGTISLFSTPEKQQQIWADVIGGNEGTVDASAGYANLWGPFGLSFNSRGFTTDGYYITPEPTRGSVDTPANVRFATGDVHLDYLGSHDHLSIHADVLAEERHNGTELTQNSTGLGTIGGNYTHSWTNDQISFLLFHTQGQFHSTYSSVSADRNTERLTALQHVPEEDIGGAAYWQHHGKDWHAVGGADFDGVHGISYDTSLSTGVLTKNGGTLVEHGIFAQGDYEIGPARLFAGMRHQFTGQNGETFISPNAGVSVGLKDFRLRASGYRSFRAPTLNELYRPFRVGNVQTLANPSLVPEGLVCYEAGVDWQHGGTQVNLTAFHNSLQDLIDNATLRTTPTLILRQRQNFPNALSRGFETNVSQTWRRWRAEAGYLYADTRLSSGQRIPQVPKQQGTAQLTYSADKTLISFGLRAYGLQFDDDLNQFLLPGYAAIGASAQQRITRRLSAIASVENLLDRQYLVALTPSPNTGQPRLWHVGLRWSGSLR
jgi:outer membrane cobalamin receptor